RSGFVLRLCIRKADEACSGAALSHGLADTRFCRKRTGALGRKCPGRSGSGFSEWPAVRWVGDRAVNVLKRKEDVVSLHVRWGRSVRWFSSKGHDDENNHIPE